MFLKNKRVIWLAILCVLWYTYYCTDMYKLLKNGGCYMKKFECTACGYIYDEALGDPDSGIAPGTKWEDIPEDWVCPLCGVGKDGFEEIQ